MVPEAISSDAAERLARPIIRPSPIFHSGRLFTATIEQMTARDSSNTHEVLSEVFRAMNTRVQDRKAANFRPWADTFPYVNGGLFSGSMEVPSFSKIARSYLLHVGGLDWTKINPDISISRSKTRP